MNRIAAIVTAGVTAGLSLAALWHGFRIGTDTETLPVLVLYLVTSSVLIGALVLRLTCVRPRRQPAARPPSRAAAPQAG
jgi:hypothetical protein